MLILLILDIFGMALSVIFSVFPSVSQLPLGMDSVMVTAVGWWYSFLTVFWPLQIVWTCFMWYLGIKIFMIILRLFLGARVPTTHV